MTSVALKVGRNDPCPCGSGKKFKHCCGVLEQSRGLKTDVASMLRGAFSLQQHGQPAQAAGLYQRILQSHPRHPEAHYLLGFIEYQAGNLTHAADLMGKALELGLTDAAAHYHYAVVLLQLLRAAEAIVQLQLALAKKPDFDEARVNLANIHFELGAFDKAEKLYRAALARNPGDWKAYNNLAHTFYHLGKIEEAIGYFEKAIETLPEYPEAHASLATMLEADNQLGRSEQETLRALELQSGNASALVVLAKILRRRHKPEAALDALDNIDPSTTTEHAYITIWNEKAKNLDLLGRYREAFMAFSQSKKEVTAFWRRPHNRAEKEFILNQTEAYFTQARLADLTKSLNYPAATGPLPIFVVGFPRSGTTLAEQVLSSHQRIGAGGELELIPLIEQSLVDKDGGGYPDNLETLVAQGQENALIAERAHYLRKLVELPIDHSGKKWVVDKLPFNMLHLPLIHLLFPESPIIHIVRHPLDTVLSGFFEVFKHGNSWSHNLADTAALYVSAARHVEALIEPLNMHYLQVKYEDLIAEPEQNIRRMLSFIGEDWDPNCLKFYENKRVARTASYEQVTRQLYSSSVNRYLNYIDMIDEQTLSLLEPVIVALGYELKCSKNAVP